MTIKRRSQKQEKAVAKELSADLVVASGAFWNLKGDIRSETILGECKTTLKDYYSITTKVWEKIREEALKDGMRVPILVIDLRDEDRYVVLDPNSFSSKLGECEVIPYNSQKSYRFTGYTEADLPLKFNIDTIKVRKKSHELVVMEISDFIETFKHEIM